LAENGAVLGVLSFRKALNGKKTTAILYNYLIKNKGARKA